MLAFVFPVLILDRGARYALSKGLKVVLCIGETLKAYPCLGIESEFGFESGWFNLNLDPEGLTLTLTPTLTLTKTLIRP